MKQEEKYFMEELIKYVFIYVMNIVILAINLGLLLFIRIVKLVYQNIVMITGNLLGNILVIVLNKITFMIRLIIQC